RDQKLVSPISTQGYFKKQGQIHHPNRNVIHPWRGGPWKRVRRELAFFGDEEQGVVVGKTQGGVLIIKAGAFIFHLNGDGRHP
ncbi:MAG: hypothetical protein U9N38_05510, partial [Thermodesulfobacteriota bacterium]|nr:hypothetical protein [Thermodesulfobacteriota bacterium]